MNDRIDDRVDIAYIPKVVNAGHLQIRGPRDAICEIASERWFGVTLWQAALAAGTQTDIIGTQTGAPLAYAFSAAYIVSCVAVGTPSSRPSATWIGATNPAAITQLFFHLSQNLTCLDRCEIEPMIAVDTVLTAPRADPDGPNSGISQG